MNDIYDFDQKEDSILPTGRRVYVILGMHRSGTSLAANILTHAGISSLPDLLPPHPTDNPDGYFESKQVYSINQRLLELSHVRWMDHGLLAEGWDSIENVNELGEEIDALLIDHLQVHETLLLKDPRLCRTFAVWSERIKALNVDLRAVRVIRRCAPVCRSLMSRFEDPSIRGAAIVDPFHGALLWLRYLMEAWFQSKGLNSTVLSYEDLIDDPKRTIKGLSATLGLNFSSSTMHKLVRHHDPRSFDGIENTLGDDLVAFLDAVYFTLLGREFGLNLDNLYCAMRDLDIPESNQENILAEDMRSLSIFASGVLKELAGRFVHPPRRLMFIESSRFSSPWLFVTHNPETRGSIYRVKNPVDALNRLGEPACWTGPGQALDTFKRLGGARAIIIHRCGWNPVIAELVDLARSQSVPIGFDIDDLVISPRIVEDDWFGYLEGRPESERRWWLKLVDSYRTMALAADFLLVSTTPLANAVAELDKPTIVVPNGFSPENMHLAEIWREHRDSKNREVFMIGYADGSGTHNRDFFQIAQSLGELMRANPHVMFRVIGHLNNDALKDLPAGQVERRPFVAHINLALELSALDLNLIPLEANPFCDSKSPLKLYESALLGVPSVASKNPVYSDLINDGVNGWLANDSTEWTRAIIRAMEPGVATAIGESARKSIAPRFHSDYIAERMLSQITALTS